MILFIYTFLRYIYLVYRFGCRINYIGTERGLTNAHPVFMDEFDKQAALINCHFSVFFGHLATFDSDSILFIIQHYKGVLIRCQNT